VRTGKAPRAVGRAATSPTMPQDATAGGRHRNHDQGVSDGSIHAVGDGCGGPALRTSRSSRRRRRQTRTFCPRSFADAHLLASSSAGTSPPKPSCDGPASCGRSSRMKRRKGWRREAATNGVRTLKKRVWTRGHTRLEPLPATPSARPSVSPAGDTLVLMKERGELKEGGDRKALSQAGIVTLAELGLNLSQSSRYQYEASVPEGGWPAPRMASPL
jgi:hypothetical protein